MNREDYILFIDGGLSNDGVGFFIGNTFITAGHVINDNIIHTINVNGRKIELKKSDAIYLNCAEYDNVSPDIPDLAIFEFNPSLTFAYPFFLLSSTLRFSFAALCTTNFSRF